MTAKDRSAEWAAETVEKASPAQREALLQALLIEMHANHIARAIVGVLPQESLPPLILPHLLDTQRVAALMTEKAREAGVKRKVTSSAVLARYGRGTLPDVGALFNDGHLFWDWEVRKALAGYNPTVGRPPAAE